MDILVTGCAGFIGMHTMQRLLQQGHHVCGVDNINDYYSPQLKLERLRQCGFDFQELEYGKWITTPDGNGEFLKASLEDREAMAELFQHRHFHVVINLAAQAGVRYSLEAPHSYVDSNITGFLNVLEGCRHNDVPHLVYASSSSVYGDNQGMPFAASDVTDHPLSIYAATKKANELMAYSYASLYGFRTTGLRFFTVYGPWGRPDMALYKFTRAILKGEAIQVYNRGEMMRDFTYIDDIVQGVCRIATQSPPAGAPKSNIYNIGRGAPVKLMAFIQEIEKTLGRKAQMELLPMQPGDVPATWADTTPIAKDYGYTPTTDVPQGVANFIQWYLDYTGK